MKCRGACGLSPASPAPGEGTAPSEGSWMGQLGAASLSGHVHSHLLIPESPQDYQPWP